LVMCQTTSRCSPEVTKLAAHISAFKHPALLNTNVQVFTRSNKTGYSH
jgi:hypothetical protein